MPGIGDREQDMQPGLHRWMAPRERFVEHDIGRLEREPAALRHRIARVHREIDDDLLQLTGVGLHQAAVADRGP